MFFNQTGSSLEMKTPKHPNVFFLKAHCGVLNLVTSEESNLNFDEAWQRKTLLNPQR